MNICEIFVSQVLALVTFFAFPVFQYIWLTALVKKEGQPELWYLPDYGFRLVIRNLPRNKTLSDIRYRTYARQVVQATPGASVATYKEKILAEVDEFFLFPGTDQVLISFKLEKKARSNKLHFIHTDKLGIEKERLPLDEITYLISDYTANIENLFNFDVKIAKQVRISSEDLGKIWEQIQARDIEQSFAVSEVRNIG